MARPKKNRVQLSDEDVKKLKAILKKKNTRRKVDGRMEAQIVEIACGLVPEGHSRWTIRLLEEQAKVELDEPVSREAIRRSLKKPASTSPKRILVSPKQGGRGICSMHGGCP